MKICMVGTGYVGLVSGACFAETGQTVVCADRDADKIAKLEEGGIPIFEPGLDELVARNVAEDRLTFTTDVAKAISESTVFFIAVGTPQRNDGGANLAAVDAVAKSIAKHAQRESIIVLKSTVPVGTNRRVRRLTENAAHRIHVVSNPEFLKEGAAIDDFMKPDRIILGCEEDDDFARELMERIYHPVSLSHSKLVWMDPVSAELTKYVANTMLAMRISFMNEVAALCDVVGGDVHSIRVGVGSDTRIGSKFLYAGPGYGGSCFPKDVKALVHTAREHGIELELAATTDRVNDRQKGVALRKVRKLLGEDLRGKRVAVWGVSFKPKTDDTRESPAITLIDALVAEGAEVVCHDPEADRSCFDHLQGKVKFAADAYSAVEGAEVLCLMTEWRQYQNPDFDRIGELMSERVLVDARNIWSSYGLRERGFVYAGVGVQG